jgi:predicted nucleotidyltransferase
MEWDDVFDAIRKAQPQLEQYHVRSIALFGSVARREANQGSDLDVLVDFSVTPSIFEFMRLKQYLEQVTDMRVDLVTHDALRPEMKEQIIKEAVDVC